MSKEEAIKRGFEILREVKEMDVNGFDRLEMLKWNKRLSAFNHGMLESWFTMFCSEQVATADAETLGKLLRMQRKTTLEILEMTDVLLQHFGAKRLSNDFVI